MAIQVEEIVAATATSHGWSVVQKRPLFAGRGPKPTVMILRRGRVIRRIILYAWRITGEGKGRRGDNYRVQATRSHEGPLVRLSGHLTIGLGWDKERQVFAAFDTWIKRFQRSSNSIHIHRDLLDGAKANGWAEEMRSDGPEAAFSPCNFDQFLRWATQQQVPRGMLVVPTNSDMQSPDVMLLSIDMAANRRVAWLRPGDYVVLHQHETLARYIWRVETIDPEDSASTKSGRPLRLRLRVARYAVISDPVKAEALVG